MSTVASFSRIRRAIVLAFVLLLALQEYPRELISEPCPESLLGRVARHTQTCVRLGGGAGGQQESLSPVPRRILSHSRSRWTLRPSLRPTPQTHAGQKRASVNRPVAATLGSLDHSSTCTPVGGVGLHPKSSHALHPTSPNSRR